MCQNIMPAFNRTGPQRSLHVCRKVLLYCFRKEKNCISFQQIWRVIRRLFQKKPVCTESFKLLARPDLNTVLRFRRRGLKVKQETWETVGSITASCTIPCRAQVTKQRKRESANCSQKQARYFSQASQNEIFKKVALLLL